MLLIVMLTLKFMGKLVFGLSIVSVNSNFSILHTRVTI